MKLSQSIAFNHAKHFLDGVTYTVGRCDDCGTKTTLNSWDDARYCATCRIDSLKDDENYSRIVCEVSFSCFGDRYHEATSSAYRAIMPLFWVTLHTMLYEMVKP